MIENEVKNPIMLFADPPTPGEVFVTVRNGRDWASRVMAGMEIDIHRARGDKAFLMKGVVVMTMICKICDIPSYILALEHDEGCREYEGLITSMRFLYKKQSINSRSEVSVLMVNPS